MYRDGHGVPEDYVMAYMWLNLAASGASGEDQKRYSAARNNVAAKMTSQQFAEAQRLAREWKSIKVN
jgi:TPR repeat protein